MGQKGDPRLFRVGPNLGNTWSSAFYVDKYNYGRVILEELKIRKLIDSRYKLAEISKILFERPLNKKFIVNIEAKKPGIVIGKSAKDIDRLKKDIERIVGIDVYINVNKVKRMDMDAALIGHNISFQLEKRVSFRKLMKKYITGAMKAGAKGIKIECSGRLGGAEIARSESYKEGSIPLHTLRSEIDYAKSSARTTYGVIGIKVWVYKGEYGLRL